VRLAEHKWHLAVLALAFLASALVYAKTFGPYLTFEGEGPIGEFLKLFLLPLTGTAIMLIVSSLRRQRSTFEHQPSAEAAIDGILLIVMLFLTSIHTLLLAVLLSLRWIGPWTPRLVVVLVGLATIGIGNLLPRTRPNYAFGIRTARTLADRQLWIVTHRVTGYVAVAVGVAIVCAGLLIDRSGVGGVAGVTGLAGAAVTLGCYWRFSVGVIRRT
jgi:immunity protein, SdpI family